MLPPLAYPFKKILHPFSHAGSPTKDDGSSASWTRKRLRSFSGRSLGRKQEGEKGEHGVQEGENGEVRVGSVGIGGNEVHHEGPLEAQHHHEELLRPQHRYLPILSGIVCPFSVLLEVPGLTERWYIRTIGFDVVETQANPVIIDVGIAISLAMGIAANFALIMRFLERRPLETTCIAIAFLVIHDLINIAAVTIFGVARRFDDGFTYGDAYWMTVASTTASLFCTLTLIGDLIMTKDFRKKGSGLSEKQRSLVIAVMILLCYLGLGSLVFSFLIQPKISYIDSLYFTLCTTAALGLGDIVPSTLASRIWIFFYATCGLCLLAFTITIARETVIESFESSYRHRRDVLANHARARKEEKRLRLKARKERREREVADHLANGTLPSSSVLQGIGGGRGGQAARTQRELTFNEETAERVGLGKAWFRRFARKMGWMKMQAPKLQETELKRETTMSSMSTVGEDAYKTFRSEMAKEQSREFRVKIFVALGLFLVFWMVGATVFHLTEHWTFFEALYFCYVVFTTIGYGDFAPKSSAGRAFFVFWALLGIATMTLLLSVLTESWSSRYKSSIIGSKVKRTLRRAGHTANASGTNQATRQLLALEGFDDEEDIDPKDLPGKLVATLKSFHAHARFFMHGRTGDTPPTLRKLIDAADEFDDELEQMRVNGDLEETAAHGETRHFLFMISYERTFDALLDAAEQLSTVFKKHQTELESMRALNAQLRSAIEDAERGAGDDGETEGVEATESGEEKPSLLPFVRRPPGGEGDDEVEEELEEEIDSPVAVDVDEEDDIPIARLSPPTIPLRRPSALAAYRRSSSMLDRLDHTTPLPPINLSRRNSTAALTTLASLEFADSTASTANVQEEPSEVEDLDEGGVVESPVAGSDASLAIPGAVEPARSRSSARTLSFVDSVKTKERKEPQ